MEPIILFRAYELEMLKEKEIAQKYLPLSDLRVGLINKLVIGRYSVLPFYKELEEDLNKQGSVLINTYKQHRYVADLFNWYSDLEEITPFTWTRLQDLPEQGPFIVKGETNSRKDQWKTHMFATSKKEAIEVACRLNDDSLMQQQKLYIRKFVPLVTYMTGLNGQPVTKEFRFFILDRKIVGSGYYWSSHVGDLDKIPDVSEVPQDFINKVIQKVGDNVRFFVVDVAQTTSGDWIVIELNDGQMSGLSEVNPDELYRNIAENFK